MITKKAKSDDGVFTVHRLEEKVYFEIPRDEGLLAIVGLLQPSVALLEQRFATRGSPEDESEDLVLPPASLDSASRMVVSLVIRRCTCFRGSSRGFCDFQFVYPTPDVMYESLGPRAQFAQAKNDRDIYAAR